MTLKVWQRMITTPQCLADTPPEPVWSSKWETEGVPMCASACPHFDRTSPVSGTCGLMDGEDASHLCIPAVEAMARLLNEDEP